MEINGGEKITFITGCAQNFPNLFRESCNLSPVFYSVWSLFIVLFMQLEWFFKIQHIFRVNNVKRESLDCLQTVWERLYDIHFSIVYSTLTTSSYRRQRFNRPIKEIYKISQVIVGNRAQMLMVEQITIKVFLLSIQRTADDGQESPSVGPVQRLVAAGVDDVQTGWPWCNNQTHDQQELF